MAGGTRQPDRRLWLIALMALVLWAVVLFFVGPHVPEAGSFGDHEVRFPASFDWTLHDLNGNPVRLEKYKGKAIFLNIWATWCPPCVAEMPSIARLAENPRLKGRGVEFVCVSTDESAPPIRQYLQGKDWGMTILRADSLPSAYQTDGIPATFAISPEGLVVGAVEGSSDWDNPQVVEFLEKLAATPAETPKK